jgi:hypothetical protein
VRASRVERCAASVVRADQRWRHDFVSLRQSKPSPILDFLKPCWLELVVTLGLLLIWPKHAEPQNAPCRPFPYVCRIDQKYFIRWVRAIPDRIRNRIPDSEMVSQDEVAIFQRQHRKCTIYLAFLKLRALLFKRCAQTIQTLLFDIIRCISGNEQPPIVFAALRPMNIAPQYDGNAPYRRFSSAIMPAGGSIPILAHRAFIVEFQPCAPNPVDYIRLNEWQITTIQSCTGVNGEIQVIRSRRRHYRRFEFPFNRVDKRTEIHCNVNMSPEGLDDCMFNSEPLVAELEHVVNGRANAILLWKTFVGPRQSSTFFRYARNGIAYLALVYGHHRACHAASKTGLIV